MIYLADDYIEKYQNVLEHLFAKAIGLNFSFSFIERKIAYSDVFSELEKSNVTLIAFNDNERIYDSIFGNSDNDLLMEDDSIYSWLGFVYIHLFLKFKVTFEMLFIALPIEKALKLYKLYHEMDITQMYVLFENAATPTSLSCIMDNKKVSVRQLAEKANVPFTTVRSLKYGYRSIDKLEANKLVALAYALNVKTETLLTSIPLTTD